ncbi:MAG: 4Fe-4S dicluster domain-containing protein [Aeropyrum sp.]|nr:4Fe-4S dicluster domain-containing protein [Aeropyrum sp.]
MEDSPVEHFFLVGDIAILVYLLSGISTAVLLYSLIEFYRRVFKNQDVRKALGQSGGLGGALRKLWLYVLLQYKVIKHRFPGVTHALIFLGILELFIATIIRALDYYAGGIILTPPFFYIYKLANNLAGIAVLVGVALALARRSLNLTPRLPKDPVYTVTLILLAIIVATGFLVQGMVVALYRYERGFESPLFDPVGYIVFLAVSNINYDFLATLYRATWLIHLALAQLGIALIPFTNLWHIPAAIANIALAPTAPPVRTLRTYEDLDERIEKDMPIGIVRLADTTWKQRLDYEACTSCMRCTNACPAAESGKILDPRGVIYGMRLALRTGDWSYRVVDPENPGDGTKPGVNPEAIWSCLTCGACVNECPVLIHHVDTIIDIRRGMMSEGSEEVPEQVLTTLQNLQYNGNPMGQPPMEKEAWFDELASKLGEDIIAREGEEYDVLYWAGCVTGYDPRIRPVGESILRLLKKAGLRAAILPYTGCTGEPALRMGEEALFVELMVSFLEELSKYKFNKLVVNCPHCLTVIGGDYKRYRNYLTAREDTRHLVEVLDNLDVEHHTVTLSKLVKEGKLSPKHTLEYRITYHDPCYLGRWNGVYEEPRDILRKSGLRIREMPRNRERSFCCGGGGGQLFYEIKRGRRVSQIRAEEASKTLGGDGYVAVACPFCNTMFRAEEENYGFKVKDVAQILDEAVEGQ